LTACWTSWAATDVGTARVCNEDAFVNRPDALIWAVADGAGGHEHGEIASAELKVALETPLDSTGRDLVAEVRTRIAAVHDALYRQASDEEAVTGLPVTIASTLVVLLAQDEHFACLWCGDSRAYLLRDGQFAQITRDHSLVQEMVDAGEITSEEAEHHPLANVLTRAIGAQSAAPELDKIIGVAQHGDRFLLCSDGLFKVLDAAAIGSIVEGPDPARTLIDAALAAAARDNVTAVVIQMSAATAPNDADGGTLQGCQLG
jgi:serine/threonine protein phosphatase Stp1